MPADTHKNYWRELSLMHVGLIAASSFTDKSDERVLQHRSTLVYTVHCTVCLYNDNKDLEPSSLRSVLRMLLLLIPSMCRRFAFSQSTWPRFSKVAFLLCWHCDGPEAMPQRLWQQKKSTVTIWATKVLSTVCMWTGSHAWIGSDLCWKSLKLYIYVL